jgi:uncharacterized protein (TIGR00369 family)
MQPFDLEKLRALSASAGFNAWADYQVVRCDPAGEVELHLKWRGEFGQYAGFLHAGMVAGLLDTSAGFAAAAVAGPVLASHFSMNCMLPAVGTSFDAIGRVVRAGKRQIFARSELFARGETGQRKLVATGEAVLMPT